VELDWAPDPNAPAHVPQVTWNHPEVGRRGRQTHPEGAFAIGGDHGGHYRPRSSRRDRSRSVSPPRAIEATWPTRASFSAAVALFGSARVHDAHLRASRVAALSAVAHAWVDQATGLRRAVERENDRGAELALSNIGQAVACAVNGDTKYERFAQHLEAVQPKEAVAPTRFRAQSVLGRRDHADGGPSGGAPNFRTKHAGA